MRVKNFTVLLMCICCSQLVKGQSCSKWGPAGDGSRISVPIAGNTWASGEDKEGGELTDNGIENWTASHTGFTAYLRVVQKGTLKISLHLSVPEGESRIEVRLVHPESDSRAELSSGTVMKAVGTPKEITITGNNREDKYVGEWRVTDTGYIAFNIKGISKTGRVFANIDSMELSGSAISGRTAYTPNNEGNFFYWGRRGPSVHLNFKAPANTNVEWFYNEVTVPKGNDVIGSYFEADGFGQGYFGMQVNSATTRHILFSVWSPYNTQNPKDIPDSLKIQLLKKGADVHAGEFGNEGSGGQSYLNYPWKAGVTYKFLLHGSPDGPDHTIFTAYFYAPEEGKWLLIASFSRPQTHGWLTGLYSFLENFSPDQGTLERRVLFGNQWICTDNGQWLELNKARFTTDNTGNKGYRMDYGGGVKGNEFYLRNCGFFSDYTPAGTLLERTLTGRQPEIDFKKLP